MPTIVKFGRTIYTQHIKINPLYLNIFSAKLTLLHNIYNTMYPILGHATDITNKRIVRQ